jgi:RNA polymerase sigma-70 factor (ECF subfamily)
VRDELERELAHIHAASFAWALRCCRMRTDEAEDVLQAAYVKVLGGKARFDGRSTIKTWFFGIVRQTATEGRRAAWLRRLAFVRWLERSPSPEPIADPETRLGQEETAVQLRRALAHLSTRQRDMLHLVFYQELTIEEAAQVLSISVGTARSHFERGKKRLRQHLIMEGHR